MLVVNLYVLYVLCLLYSSFIITIHSYVNHDTEVQKGVQILNVSWRVDKRMIYRLSLLSRSATTKFIGPNVAATIILILVWMKIENCLKAHSFGNEGLYSFW